MVGGGGCGGDGADAAGLCDILQEIETPPDDVGVDMGAVFNCDTRSWGDAALCPLPTTEAAAAETPCWLDEDDDDDEMIVILFPVEVQEVEVVGGLVENKVDDESVVNVVLAESRRHSRGCQSVFTNEKSRNSSWFIAFTIIGSICVRTGSSDVKSLSKLLVSFSSF